MSERRALVFQILSLAKRLSRELDAIHAECDGANLSGVNARILIYLAARDGSDVFQRDIEEAFDSRRSTVSKVVRLMERKGLIVRERVARDARLRRLCLTDSARQICADTQRELERFEARMTARLTPEEARQLGALLAKIGEEDARL